MAPRRSEAVVWFTNDERGLVAQSLPTSLLQRRIRRQHGGWTGKIIVIVSDDGRHARQDGAGLAGAYPAAEAGVGERSAVPEPKPRGTDRRRPPDDFVGKGGASSTAARLRSRSRPLPPRWTMKFRFEGGSSRRWASALKSVRPAAAHEGDSAVVDNTNGVTSLSRIRAIWQNFRAPSRRLIVRPQWAIWRWMRKPNGGWQKPPFKRGSPMACQHQRILVRGPITRLRWMRCRLGTPTASPTC